MDEHKGEMENVFCANGFTVSAESLEEESARTVTKRTTEHSVFTIRPHENLQLN
jgi:hypothetical protein